MHHCVLFQTGLQETVNMTCRQFSDINSSSSQVECVKLVSDLRSSACPAGRLPEMILLSDYVHFWRILKKHARGLYLYLFFYYLKTRRKHHISNFNLAFANKLQFANDPFFLFGSHWLMFECEITPSGYSGCTFLMGSLLPSDSLRSKADILAL